MWSATASVPWPCFARWIRFPPEIGHAGGRPCSPKPEQPGFISPFPPVLPSVPSRIRNPTTWPARCRRFRPCVAGKIGKRWTASGTPAPWSRSYFARFTAPALRPLFGRPMPFLLGTGCNWKRKPHSLGDRPGTGIGKAGQISGGYFSGFICRQGSGRKFRN
jgi:hypothetical protein